MQRAPTRMRPAHASRRRLGSRSYRKSEIYFKPARTNSRRGWSRRCPKPNGLPPSRPSSRHCAALEAKVRAKAEARAEAEAEAPRTATPRQRPARRRTDARWLPSEAMIGVMLLVFGLTVAVLILAGVVKLGVAP